MHIIQGQTSTAKICILVKAKVLQLLTVTLSYLFILFRVFRAKESSDRLRVAPNEMHFKLERTSHIASWCLLRCLCVVTDGGLRTH